MPTNNTKYSETAMEVGKKFNQMIADALSGSETGELLPNLTALVDAAYAPLIRDIPMLIKAAEIGLLHALSLESATAIESIIISVRQRLADATPRGGNDAGK